MGMSAGIKAIVGALVIVIIGLLLTPTVIAQVNGLTTGTGSLASDTTGAKDIVNLIKIIWVLGVLGGAVGFLYVQFRSSGGM